MFFPAVKVSFSKNYLCGLNNRMILSGHALFLMRDMKLSLCADAIAIIIMVYILVKPQMTTQFFDGITHKPNFTS